MGMIFPLIFLYDEQRIPLIRVYTVCYFVMAYQIVSSTKKVKNTQLRTYSETTHYVCQNVKTVHTFMLLYWSWLTKVMLNLNSNISPKYKFCICVYVMKYGEQKLYVKTAWISNCIRTSVNWSSKLLSF